MKYGICNAKAKVEGGGGATLNLAYGLTPPEDTTKIWVKCNEPTAVKVEANRQLVVSSNENAKVLTETAIAKTNIGSGNYYNPNPKMVKIGSDYYIIAGIGNDACYMNDYQIIKWKVYKMTSAGVVSELCDVNSWISTSYAQMYGLFKYDDTHLLLVAGNSNQSSRMFLFLIDITTTNSFVGQTISNTTLGTNMCFDGNVVYGMKYNYSDNTKVQIFTYSLNDTTSTILLDMPTGYVRAYNTNNSPIVYNGAIYFIVNTSSTEVKLMKWVINSNEISVFMDLPKIKINDTDYNLNYATPHLFGNKIIYTNISNDFDNSAPTGTDLYNGVYVVDLIAKTCDIIPLNDDYALAYTCIDENNGNIEIWGGYPTSSQGKIKKVISQIYTLSENTLDLYYDTYSTKNIRLINEATLTMDAPINHCWLGDSNNIAQPVDMYYYDNGTWKGINCADYSE